MAKRKRIPNWNSLRKEELVKAIVKTESKSGSTKSTAKGSSAKDSSVKSTKKSAASPSSSRKASAAKRSVVPAPKGNVAKAAAKKGANLKAASSKGASAKSAAPKAASAKPAAAKTAASKPAVAKAAAKSPAAKPSSQKSSPAKAKGTQGAAARGKETAAKVSAAAIAKAKSKVEVSKETAPRATSAAAKPNAARETKVEAQASSPKIAKPAKPPVQEKTKTSARVIRKIQEAHERMDRRRDLAGDGNGNNARHSKDRCALLVRDPYWLQAYWEISRETVERAKVALAANWHTVQPMLRLAEIDDAGTTSTAERIVREIPIHGGVCNWYIDVVEPPKTYRVTLGYKAATGKFHTLARSNKVTTPSPGASDMIDGNWADIAENCEKIFAMSGGYAQENSDQQLRELFEERLRRPMGSPSVTQYGSGADMSLGRMRDFEFAVDAEMIVFGHTDATAYVTLGGEPIKLRGDGTFAVRLPLPDRRQVLPIVASSADGVEQRTTVLAVERNTKVMEPLIRENGED